MVRKKKKSNKKRKISNTSDEMKFRIKNSTRPPKIEISKNVYDRKKEKFNYKKIDKNWDEKWYIHHHISTSKIIEKIQSHKK